MEFLHHESLGTVMLQETKREKSDARFVVSVQTTRDKEWATLLACDALGSVLIIQDSSKYNWCQDPSKFRLSQFQMDNRSFGLSLCIAPMIPLLERVFQVGVVDLFGLTYLKWYVYVYVCVTLTYLNSLKKVS